MAHFTRKIKIWSKRLFLISFFKAKLLHGVWDVFQHRGFRHGPIELSRHSRWLNVGPLVKDRKLVQSVSSTPFRHSGWYLGSDKRLWLYDCFNTVFAFSQTILFLKNCDFKETNHARTLLKMKLFSKWILSSYWAF